MYKIQQAVQNLAESTTVYVTRAMDSVICWSSTSPLSFLDALLASTWKSGKNPGRSAGFAAQQLSRSSRTSAGQSAGTLNLFPDSKNLRI